MATRSSFELIDDNGHTIAMEEAVQGRNAEMYKFDFGVKVAVDKATGKVTGIREYEFLKLTKPLCKASPIIFKKLCEGKKLKAAILRFYRHDLVDGSERQFYTFTFEDVSLVAQRLVGLDDVSEVSRHYPVLEEISLIAEKVTQTFMDGNIEHTDEYRKKV